MEMASRKEECAGQRSLFGDCTEEFDEPEMPDVPEYEPRERLKLEKESVGIYISGHPYDHYAEYGLKYATCSVHDLAHWKMPDAPAVILGLLVDYREKLTKRGEPMGILTVEDTDGQAEVVCFPRQWPHVKPLLETGAPYVISGDVRNEGDASLLLKELSPLSEVLEKDAGVLRIRVEGDGLSNDFYDVLYSELAAFPGNLPVLLDLRMPEHHALLKMRSVRVCRTPELAKRIDKLSDGNAVLL